ncbi:unnamed protein product [Ectocarpus sp. CCAP 1310/34]|nr:unnamed protein product [Ectocarpus sp. CCAP 1310/34]
MSARMYSAQIKRYSPSQDALGEAAASEVLLEIFKSILREFGLRPSDLASGTTDSGSDVKSASVNGLYPQYGVLWNWCFCHLMVKAAEDGFGTHVDPQKSKNPEARDMLKNVISMVGTLNRSSNFKAKFEDLQVDLLGDVLKIPNQAPQRWLTQVRTLERVIRLWHVLRKLYSDAGKNFPLEEGDNKNAILQLFSLLQSLSSVTRDGQYGNAPMQADVFMKFGELKMEVLDPSKPLKVFDIPPLGQDGLPDREEQKKALPHKMVEPDDLHPVAKKARSKLGRALVSRLYGRVWDHNTLDPSFFCDASCLLTPPFSEGHHLSAMKLTAEEHAYLPAGSVVVAPTSYEEVKEKLDGVWTKIKQGAVKAVKTAQSEAEGSGGDGSGGLFKRARTRHSGSSRRKNPEEHQFACFGRTETTQEDSQGESDVVEDDVGGEIMRYKGVFIKSTQRSPQLLEEHRETLISRPQVCGAANIRQSSLCRSGRE